MHRTSIDEPAGRRPTFDVATDPPAPPARRGDESDARAVRGARRRFDPMSGTLPMLALNVVWTLVVTTSCGILAAWVADDRVTELLVWVGVSAIALYLLTALPLRHFLLSQRVVAAERERLLREQSERRHFESRMVRALEMADDKQGALDVAVRALGEVMPTTRREILLADSSRAHLSLAATSDTSTSETPTSETPLSDTSTTASCAVDTPRRCPAVRAGHALRFDDTDALDACPFLRSRHPDVATALCVPLSVMGSITGVVHLTRGKPESFTQSQVTLVTSVAEQFGSRVGLLTAMAQSELQASTDPLTGLLNRRSLEEATRGLVAAATPFAVVLADLDHFKTLNDTYGHDAGDRALRVFARVLRSVVRDGDLVCRYGGEEFLIVFPGTNATGAAQVVDRLRLELDAAFADGRTPVFTVSAGASDTTHGHDLADLITEADRALLEAKRNGRNRTVVGAGC